MEKHTSLLIMLYLTGLVSGITGALILSPDPLNNQLPVCLTSVCATLPSIPQMFASLLISGTIAALLTLLLSRALHWLFFVEND